MIAEIEKLVQSIEKSEIYNDYIKINEPAKIEYKNQMYTIHSFVMGTSEPQAPTFLLVGGVHGLERIGAQLCSIYLKHLVDRIVWDGALRDVLKKIRIVFVPLLNPVGYTHYTRCNGNGVDLMRNAPIESIEKVPFLLGGHRFSNRLPWYRGIENQIEIENQVLIKIFNENCIQSECLVALDLHSGFGLKDQLWFPHSYTKTPFLHLPHLHALTTLFEKTYPYHIYKIEPQSHVYHIHGDIWDYLYLNFKMKNSKVFIPLTLEMGSWNWIKKNPLQLFMSKAGLFNPIKDHRKRRTLRRHHLLLDFIMHALLSHSSWTDLDKSLHYKHESLAHERWY